MIPIVDTILREGPGRGMRAIVVYPMNALANSQRGELVRRILLRVFACHYRIQTPRPAELSSENLASPIQVG